VYIALRSTTSKRSAWRSSAPRRHEVLGKYACGAMTRPRRRRLSRARSANVATSSAPSLKFSSSDARHEHDAAFGGVRGERPDVELLLVQRDREPLVAQRGGAVD